MENPNQINRVRFQDIVFDAEGINLLSGQSKILFIAKRDIQKITLKHGFQSERPIAEIVFGIFVVGLGLYFFLNFLLEIVVHRLIYLEDLLSLFLLPIGAWFVIDGFRKRFYFEVVLNNDRRKFPLRKSTDTGELQKFIKTASLLGYPVDITILDNNLLD